MCQIQDPLSDHPQSLRSIDERFARSHTREGKSAESYTGYFRRCGRQSSDRTATITSASCVCGRICWRWDYIKEEKERQKEVIPWLRTCVASDENAQLLLLPEIRDNHSHYVLECVACSLAGKPGSEAVESNLTMAVSCICPRRQAACLKRCSITERLFKHITVGVGCNRSQLRQSWFPYTNLGRAIVHVEGRGVER